MKKTVYAIECVTIPISDEQRYWGCSGLDEFTDIINCSFWTNKENAKEFLNSGVCEIPEFSVVRIAEVNIEVNEVECYKVM